MLPCKGVDCWTCVMPICVMQWMCIRASAADSHPLVMVSAKYFLSLRNVLCHRLRSADVVCNVLEIRSNLQLNKFGKTMAEPSTALLERSFSALSHLLRQRKSSHMKIQDDGSLIDIDVSLSEPDTG